MIGPNWRNDGCNNVDFRGCFSFRLIVGQSSPFAQCTDMTDEAQPVSLYPPPIPPRLAAPPPAFISDPSGSRRQDRPKSEMWGDMALGFARPTPTFRRSSAEIQGVVMPRRKAHGDNSKRRASIYEDKRYSGSSWNAEPQKIAIHEEVCAPTETDPMVIGAEIRQAVLVELMSRPRMVHSATPSRDAVSGSEALVKSQTVSAGQPVDVKVAGSPGSPLLPPPTITHSSPAPTQQIAEPAAAISLAPDPGPTESQDVARPLPSSGSAGTERDSDTSASQVMSTPSIPPAIRSGAPSSGPDDARPKMKTKKSLKDLFKFGSPAPPVPPLPTRPEPVQGGVLRSRSAHAPRDTAAANESSEPHHDHAASSSSAGRPGHLRDADSGEACELEPVKGADEPDSRRRMITSRFSLSSLKGVLRKRSRSLSGKSETGGAERGDLVEAVIPDVPALPAQFRDKSARVRETSVPFGPRRSTEVSAMSCEWGPADLQTVASAKSRASSDQGPPVEEQKERPASPVRWSRRRLSTTLSPLERLIRSPTRTVWGLDPSDEEAADRSSILEPDEKSVPHLVFKPLAGDTLGKRIGRIARTRGITVSVPPVRHSLEATILLRATPPRQDAPRAGPRSTRDGIAASTSFLRLSFEDPTEPTDAVADVTEVPALSPTLLFPSLLPQESLEDERRPSVASELSDQILTPPQSSTFPLDLGGKPAAHNGPPRTESFHSLASVAYEEAHDTFPTPAAAYPTPRRRSQTLTKWSRELRRVSMDSVSVWSFDQAYVARWSSVTQGVRIGTLRFDELGLDFERADYLDLAQ